MPTTEDAGMQHANGTNGDIEENGATSWNANDSGGGFGDQDDNYGPIGIKEDG